MNCSRLCVKAALTGIFCLIAFALPGIAGAAPVSVTMSFDSFSGTVGSSFQFVTYFDSGSGAMILCPDTGCQTGVGTTKFQLGGGSQVEFWSSEFGVDATHNVISFASSGVNDAVLGQEFLLGKLTYTNGIWFADPEFGVTFSSTSSDVAFDKKSWTDTIHLSITPNLTTNTPDQNADFIYLTGLPKLGSVRVYELGESKEGNSVTVDLYGRISSLDLTRFANATGGGFLDSSIELEPTPPASVPAPATFVLVSIGLAGLGLLRRLSRWETSAARLSRCSDTR